MSIDQGDCNGVGKANGHRLVELALIVAASTILQGCGRISDSAPPRITPIVDEPAKPAEKPGTVISNSVGMELAHILAGEFLIGSPDTDVTVRDLQKPPHRVRITKPFHLGVHEVTRGEWEDVMGTTPWKNWVTAKEGDRYPAIHVCWDDATEFCRTLTEKERRAGRLKPGESYRLPTEAEWEYACRAGSRTVYHFGIGAGGSLGEYDWYKDNAVYIDEKYAHEVGLKRANAWGLFDMHGNVSEWCSDWYGKYEESAVTDPQGPSEGSSRVYRGGNWNRYASYCQSASRNGLFPSYSSDELGFRVVRSSAPND